MPKNNSIIKLPGFRVNKINDVNPIEIDAVYTRKTGCIHCGCKRLRNKGSFMREVRHILIGGSRSILRFKAHKFKCYGCGRYFNQRFPGIKKYQRATEKCREEIFYWHSKGVSQKDLARDIRAGKSTVERWYHSIYAEEHKTITQPHWPRVLGIDEHSFSKKQGFSTTFCNLAKHKLFDIAKGKSEKELADFIKRIPGRERVKMICIDLSSSFRALAEKYFPNAKIVADRFHVIRLLHQLALKTFHHIDPDIKYNRGMLAALRKKPKNLTDKQKKRRDEYLKKCPAAKVIYVFIHRLHKLLLHKHCTAKKCRRMIPRFLTAVQQLRISGFESLNTLGNTLWKWKDEIARMWRFTKNNGITEGFHRKMKLIQRRAYGFRNFENYRIRVKVLCG